MNRVIQGKSQDYKREKKSDDYLGMKEVFDNLDRVEKRTKQDLKRPGNIDFERRVNFVLSSGKIFDLSVEECLFQSFTGSSTTWMS